MWPVQRRNLGLDGPRQRHAGAVAKHLGGWIEKIPGWESWKTVASVTTYRSISGKAKASNTPTTRCLPFLALTNFQAWLDDTPAQHLHPDL
jgi:hypothetical protein